MGLDSVELVMAFEDAFDVVISDDAMSALLKISDVATYIVSELNRLGRPQDPEDVLNRIMVITSEHLGVPRDRINPGSRIVEDLGVD